MTAEEYVVRKLEDCEKKSEKLAECFLKQSAEFETLTNIIRKYMTIRETAGSGAYVVDAKYIWEKHNKEDFNYIAEVLGWSAPEGGTETVGVESNGESA